VVPWSLAKMNMILHGHAGAELWKGNTIGHDIQYSWRHLNEPVVTGATLKSVFQWYDVAIFTCLSRN
jgi:hypothetical protein